MCIDGLCVTFSNVKTKRFHDATHSSSSSSTDDENKKFYIYPIYFDSHPKLKFNFACVTYAPNDTAVRLWACEVDAKEFENAPNSLKQNASKFLVSKKSEDYNFRLETNPMRVMAYF